MSSSALSADSVEQIAAKHGVSAAAVEAIAEAMAVTAGHSAQFNHAELGGMGQWMGNGMLMIGDMFNTALKAKVDDVCRDVADAVKREAVHSNKQGVRRVSTDWWPSGLGTPSSVGAQNAMRYAFFPAARRLVIDEDGKLAIYDTGSHVLTGFAQQQGPGQRLAFSTRDGAVDIGALRRIADVPDEP